MLILSLDLGKFKSVFCAYDRETRKPRFATVVTSPTEFQRVLERERPDVVVFETCTIAGWVADLCETLGLAYQVANPLHEAWSWRKVKRKTDRDDAQRFHSGKEVSAYAGLVPRQFQSGELDRRGRITKRGPGLLRKVLVEASWLLLRYNTWASRLFVRLTRGQKVRRKPALVALARKLLVRCWAMLRDGRPWRESVPLAAAVPS